MSKKYVTLEQAISLAILTIKENEVAIFVTDSVAATEQKKSLWSRLFGK
ncbi:hypothetical protein ACQKOD_29460 [Bacillus mycoides]